MDEAAFHKNEKPNEYDVRFSITGDIYVSIKADSLEDAKAKANAMLEEEGFGLDIDEVTDASVGSVRKTRPMFLVTSEGRSMQVSHLQDGDLPRDPDEHGF